MYYFKFKPSRSTLSTSTRNKLKSVPIVAMASTLMACSAVPNMANIQSSTTAIRQTKQSDAQFEADNSRHEFKLENGLKVIVKEDHRAPVVMSQVWYSVGSADEPDGKGGISHLLEHMMFKGTDKVSGADFNRVVSKFGGSHNAFTSHDYTAYYEMFPANRFDLALELEADRMTNLQFNSEEFVSEFTKEREVVMEERRQRTDDNPLSRSYEKFRVMALPDSPKGQSVIGPMDEIASIEIKDLEAWYNAWYTPNNATVVIVGDVTPNDALKKVKKYFAHIESKPLPKRPSLTHSTMRGYKKTTLTEAVNVPTLLMAFNVPTLTSALASGENEDKAYELLMLQFVLDGGYAARFEKSLVREQGLLASVMSHYSMYDRGDSLFLIQATPREGVSLQQAEAAILSEINKLKDLEISQKELDRAKSNVVKGFIFAQDSMSGQAQAIGSMQARGLDDRHMTRLPKHLNKVTSQDINDITSKYLIKDNLTVMHIEPKEKK